MPNDANPKKEDLLLEEGLASEFREEHPGDLWKLLVTPPPTLPNVWDQVALLIGRGYSDDSHTGTDASIHSERDGGYEEEEEG